MSNPLSSAECSNSVSNSFSISIKHSDSQGTPIYQSNFNSQSRGDYSDNMVVAINKEGIEKMLAVVKDSRFSMPNQNRGQLLDVKKEANSRRVFKNNNKT